MPAVALYPRRSAVPLLMSSWKTNSQQAVCSSQEKRDGFKRSPVVAATPRRQHCALLECFADGAARCGPGLRMPPPGVRRARAAAPTRRAAGVVAASTGDAETQRIKRIDTRDFKRKELDYEAIADEYARVMAALSATQPQALTNDTNDWQQLKEPLGLFRTASRDEVVSNNIHLSLLKL